MPGDSGGAAVGKKPFGFAWFVPELLRQKRLWRDILLASLAIQLGGLATVKSLQLEPDVDKRYGSHLVQ